MPSDCTTMKRAPRDRGPRSRQIRIAAAAALAAAALADPTLAAFHEGPWAPVPGPYLSGHEAVHDTYYDRLILLAGSIGNGRVWAINLDWPTHPYEIVAPGAPPGYEGRSAVYDPVRRRVLVYGGQTIQSVVRSDLWALALNGPPSWTRLEPTTGPGARMGAQLHYDSRRDALLLFGGWDAQYQIRDDLWMLPLSGPAALQWREIAISGERPPLRFDPVTVIDPDEDRLVLALGFAADALGDAWALPLADELETREWMRLPEAPKARQGARGVYSPERKGVVVFGGVHIDWTTAGTQLLELDDTPEWKSADFGVTPYLRRGGHAVAYDALRGRMLVTGGDAFEDSGLPDLWALDLRGASGWQSIVAYDEYPPGRMWARAAFDPDGDRMLMFGGFYDGSYYHGDLWSLDFNDGTKWSRYAENLWPGRVADAIVVDSARDRLLMFGGTYHEDHRGTTYHSDLLTRPLSAPSAPWAEITPAGPGPRRAKLMFVDDASDSLVALGTGTLWEPVVPGFWKWGLAGAGGWVSVPTSGDVPPARTGAAVYDAQRREIVVLARRAFEAEATRPDSIWILALGSNTWRVEIVPEITPSPFERDLQPVYDSARGRIVVYAVKHGATWVLDRSGSAAWVPLVSSTSAPVLDGSSLVYDPVRDRLIMYGGDRDQGEVWALQFLSERTSVLPGPPARAAAALAPPSPNPLTASTRLSFHAGAPGRVELDVLDVNGRRVRTLLHGALDAGTHAATWDGRSDQGTRLPAGIYFVRLRTGATIESRKVVLAR
jgi:hypothetical protein